MIFHRRDRRHVGSALVEPSFRTTPSAFPPRARFILFLPSQSESPLN
jgi:hypothetical protein